MRLKNVIYLASYKPKILQQMIKKLLFSTLITAGIATTVNAQNAIPNPGFENWTQGGGYADPDGWGTINSNVSGFCFCTGTARKTTTAHSGSFAVQLVTISVFGSAAPGIAATGTINTTTQLIDGGIAYNLRPASVSGWYKYAPTGGDTGSVDVTLSKWNTTTLQRDIVGHARFEVSTTVSSYTMFTQPFTYSLPDNPDTMVVILLSSRPDLSSANVNSTMYVDDLDLDITTTGITQNNMESSFNVYPNPNDGNFDVAFSSTSNDTYKLELRNALGQLVYQESVLDFRGNYGKQLNVGQYGKGIYTLSLTTANNKTANVKKVVVY
jgi:hypothetical protein